MAVAAVVDLMGLQPLGARWRRRIQFVTGCRVVHASGSGGYVFRFTTSDHRHGWFDLKAYRAWIKYGGGPSDHGVWGLWPQEEDNCATSCGELFPEDYEQRRRRFQMDYLGRRMGMSEGAGGGVR